MNTLYWVKEYIFVLLAYAVVMFVWPEIVFRKYLKGRTLTMRICFDSMFMIFATNMVILLLGLCHILNPWVVRILFWGGLLASVVVPFVKENGSHTLQRFAALLTGGYGIKSFGRNVAEGTTGVVNKGRKSVNRRLINHVIIYSLVGMLIVYGMIYYGYGAMQSPTYGFPDIIVHHKWIYSMEEGKIFSHGIYPEGMHTFVYLLSTCFGVSVYSVLLFLQPINMGLFLLAIFLLTKELFNWRYTGVFVLILFLTLDYGVDTTLYAFSRLQCSLPQEFGAVAVILCPVFLLRYLKKVRENSREIFGKKIYQNEDIVVFALALFVTISVHFYCTIFAFFLCLPIVPFFFKEVFSWKSFIRLFAAVIGSVALAVLPMLLALLEGMKFQGSIGWAISVIQGERGEGSSDVVPTPGPGIEVPGVEEQEGILELLKRTGGDLFDKNVRRVFDEKTAHFFVNAAGIAIVSIIIVGVICLTVSFVRKKKGLERVKVIDLTTLVAALFMMLNIIILRNPRTIGLPELVEGIRVGYYATLFSIVVLVIPLDIFIGLLKRHITENSEGLIAISIALVAIVLVIDTDNYHGTLYFDLTRYDAAVNTTVKIMEENEKQKYTIVSTGDENWQLSKLGYHEELVHFINECRKTTYTLPSEKIYIYVEKHPLHHVQKHFVKVPVWIADNAKSQRLYEYTKLVTTGKGETIHYELDDEISAMINGWFVEDAAVYRGKLTRITLETKMMNWVKAFDVLYPRTLKVFYEDDDFVCYYFEQNPNVPYELAIQGN